MRFGNSFLISQELWLPGAEETLQDMFLLAFTAGCGNAYTRLRGIHLGNGPFM